MPELPLGLRDSAQELFRRFGAHSADDALKIFEAEDRSAITDERSLDAALRAFERDHCHLFMGSDIHDESRSLDQRTASFARDIERREQRLLLDSGRARLGDAKFGDASVSDDELFAHVLREVFE
jgi:hypothetical protein